jgi:hypothetical protein
MYRDTDEILKILNILSEKYDILFDTYGSV